MRKNIPNKFNWKLKVGCVKKFRIRNKNNSELKYFAVKEQIVEE